MQNNSQRPQKDITDYIGDANSLYKTSELIYVNTLPYIPYFTYIYNIGTIYAITVYTVYTLYSYVIYV